MKTVPIALSTLLLASCTTAKDSTLLGMGVGALVGGGMGAAVGSSSGDQQKGAMIGAAVGTALGGITGYMKHKGDEKLAHIPAGKQILENSEPSLTQPRVRKVWIPPRVEGEQYVTGHWIYVIERNSNWQKE